MTQSSSSDKLVKCSVDRVANAASASDPPSPPIPTDAAIEYFDVLLGAVVARLRFAAQDGRTDANATSPKVALQRLRTTVMECVEALEQLQATQGYLRG